jgi:hypothetical protein
MALVVGALSAWPLVYFAGFMAMMAVSSGRGGPFADATTFDLLVRAHLITMVVTMGLLGFYVTHAFRSPRLPQEQRVLWLIVLFMGNMLAFPVYWYLHVWRR